MANDNDSYNVKATLKVLAELGDLAENATLTGALSSGLPRAIERYNGILSQLIEHGTVPGGMFTPLPADASFGDLAVDARLVKAYIKEGNGNSGGGPFAPEKHLILRLAPFANSSDLRELVDAYLAEGSAVDASLIENLAPFLDSDHLGTLIRRIARQGRGDEVKSPAPPTPPQPPTPPSPPREPAEPASVHSHVVRIGEDEPSSEREPEALAHHDVPVADRLRALTDRMRDPDISAEEFEELSAEVVRLKREAAGR
jgi:hypothetical protein